MILVDTGPLVALLDTQKMTMSIASAKTRFRNLERAGLGDGLAGFDRGHVSFAVLIGTPKTLSGR